MTCKSGQTRGGHQCKVTQMWPTPAPAMGATGRRLWERASGGRLQPSGECLARGRAPAGILEGTGKATGGPSASKPRLGASGRFHETLAQEAKEAGFCLQGRYQGGP